MLNSLTLKNFQAHRDLHLELRPGLNVIVGESDTGKSSIVRALRFLMLHESASNLMTNGESEMAVRVLLEPGHTISRFRSPKEFGYRLNDQDKFVACAREQPAPIQTLFNLTSTNFQGQFDPHFLLCLTPGQTAREINKIVALDDIDKALGWLKERIKKTGTRLEDLDTEIHGLADDIAARKNIPLMGDILQSMAQVRDAAADAVSRRTGLEAAYGSFLEARKTYARENAKLAPVAAAVAAGELYKAAKATRTALESIIQAIEGVETIPTLRRLESELEALIAARSRSLVLTATIADFCVTCDTISANKSRIVSIIDDFGSMLVSRPRRSYLLHSLTTDCERINNEIQLDTTTLMNLEQSLPRQTICPKCGFVLSDRYANGDAPRL